jgi:hypothetical protein
VGPEEERKEEGSEEKEKEGEDGEKCAKRVR